MYTLKRFVCSKCEKELANRHSLSRQKKACQSAPYNIAATLPTYNVPTQLLPTFVAAAVKETSVEHRPTNPKIKSLLEEIINDDLDRNVTSQAIHKGFSIVPPTTTSLFSRPLRLLAPESQSALTREEPVMKKFKLSSPRSKEDIIGEERDLPQPTRIEYSDTDDDDDESPLDYSDDDSEMNPRTKGDIIGYSKEDDDQDSEMDQEQHIEKEVPQTDDEDLEDRFNHLLIEYTREKKSESG